MAKLIPSRHDLPADTRQKLVELLQKQLYDVSDLYGQSKHAHWNVKGKDFYQLHLLFDKLAETVEGHIDTIAERITALGGVALGTARKVAAGSRVEEFPDDLHEGQAATAALADRYATAGKHVRQAIDAADDLGDKDTADLFTDVSRDLDQSLYFLESHLQK